VNTNLVERIRALVAPLLADLGLQLYDLEHAGGVLRLTVERPGGVDLEAIALATRVVSRELDHADPIPGRYTLEVTSPGLERHLRTPAHFQAAVGSVVAVRTQPGVDGERRVNGTLAEADDEGITVTERDSGEARRLRYAEVERARTVFEWGSAAPTRGGPGNKRRTPSMGSPQQRAQRKAEAS
jgi:ribosome maturation factor RimP